MEEAQKLLARRKLALWRRLDADHEFQELFWQPVVAGMESESLAKLLKCNDADLPKCRAVWQVFADPANGLSSYITRNLKSGIEYEAISNQPPQSL